MIKTKTFQYRHSFLTVEPHWSLYDGTEEEENTSMCMCHLIVLRKQAYQCFPTSTFFPQLWCQGLVAVSGINLNTLFVTLNLQINPSSHTQIYMKYNWGEMSLVFLSFSVPWGALNNISACFCSPSIHLHPVFPWSFYEHLLMQSFLPLGATSVALCMVAGLKL